MKSTSPDGHSRRRHRRNTQSESTNVDRGPAQDQIPKIGEATRRILRRTYTSLDLRDKDSDFSQAIPGDSVEVRYEALPEGPWTTIVIPYRYVKSKDVKREVARLLGAPAIPEEPGDHKQNGAAAPHPEIWRTAIRHRGSRLSPETYHHSLTEVDYENIESHDASPAFETRKHVTTIRPFGNLKNSEIEPPRNAVLDNDIVDQVLSEQMIVRSPQLLRAIKDTVHWPSAAFYDGQTRLTLNSPFRSIGVHRAEFDRVLERNRVALHNSQISERHDTKDTSESTTSKTRDLKLTVRHLELFLKEIDKVQAQDLKLEKARHERGFATFDMLWMLLKPGMKVHTSAHGPSLACIIELLVWNRGTRTESGDGPYEYVEVQMWYRDHDGKQINRRMHEVTIHRFAGEIAIGKLPICPDGFVHDELIAQRGLINRGKKYTELIKNTFSLIQYHGTLSISDADPYEPQTHRFYSGKVIVDPEQHYHEHGTNQSVLWHEKPDADFNTPSLQPDGGAVVSSSHLNHKQTDRSSDRPDQYYELLHEWIRGFTIEPRAQRRWVWIKVDCVRAYEPDHSLMKTVSLSEDSINLLKLMTQDDGLHEAEVRLFQKVERIPHKGEGRVIILHGVPGLGKTYTVECLAEWSGRPLLRLASTDLDLNPMELEQNLGLFFDRAERWKAIVFLDEADIYLSKRLPSNDIQREAVVAVFLRALEYYSGIIFLTTNRIDVVDRAIINRALLILHYEPLTRTGRAKICGHCLENFKKNEGTRIDRGAEDYFITSIMTDEDYDWDGREIVQALLCLGVSTVSVNAFFLVLTLAAVLARCSYGVRDMTSDFLVNEDHVRKAMAAIKLHAVHKKENKNKQVGYREDHMG